MKTTLEVDDGQEAVVLLKGTYAWAVAMEAQGKRVELCCGTTAHPVWRGASPTDSSFTGCNGWRLAPLSPAEELLAALDEAFRGTAWYRPDRLKAAIAAVEAEIAAKKAGQEK